jgi:hypothetical protein
MRHELQRLSNSKLVGRGSAATARAVGNHGGGRRDTRAARHEPDNPANGRAVLITISTYTLRCLLGAELVSVPANDTTKPKTACWRLGYIRRSEPGRDELWQSLQQRDDLLDARLVLEGHDWWVRVRKAREADPNDWDANIPF